MNRRPRNGHLSRANALKEDRRNHGLGIVEILLWIAVGVVSTLAAQTWLDFFSLYN